MTTETTAEIVPVSPAARVLASRTVMTLATLDDVARVASIAARSGLARCTKPEEAAIILMTGMELGLTPMQSLRGIYIVEGRPVLAADTMVAIVTRSGACRYWRTIETTAERCAIETQRVDDATVYRRVWTLDDAKRAGLVGKGTWAKYPAAMLRHRCAADLAREIYPEILLGMYDPDEISTDGIDARPTPQRARVESAPVVVAAHAQPDPRDLASLGVEAPARAVAAQPVEAPAAPAPLAFATPGLSDAEMAAMLAMLNACETIAALDATRAEIRPDVSTRASASQRAHLRAAAEARRAALSPTEPPTPPRGGRKSARNDGATGDATHHEPAPSAEAQASIARVEAAGGVHAYLASKATYTEVQRAVMTHGRHVPGLCDAAVARLEALDAGDEANRRRIVETWRDEGAHREQRATTTAAKVRRAA